MRVLTPLLFFLLAIVRPARAQDTLILHYDDLLKRTADTTTPIIGILIRQGEGWSATVVLVPSLNRVMTGYYAADAQTEEGPFDYYVPGGGIYQHGYFHQGKKVGTWKGWDDSHRLTDSLIFNNDSILLDVHFYYRENGQLQSFTLTDNRTQHRLSRDYYPSGTLSGDKEWWGKRGLVKLFYENGALAYVKSYDSTGARGETHYYNPQKKEISQEQFDAFTRNEAPEFKGGSTALQHYFEKNMKVPGTNHRSGTPQKVTITFMLDERGKAYNIEVMEYSDLQWQQAAIDFFERMPGWDMKVHKTWGPLTYSFLINN